MCKDPRRLGNGRKWKATACSEGEEGRNALARSTRDDTLYREGGDASGNGAAPVRLGSIIASNWALIAITAALAVLAAIVYSAAATKRYEAHAQIVVSP